MEFDVLLGLYKHKKVLLITAIGLVQFFFYVLYIFDDIIFVVTTRCIDKNYDIVEHFFGDSCARLIGKCKVLDLM
jgi:hypothetical protein